MIRLALLRHGHTDWNRAGRIQGATDIPLDDQARADLAEFALPAPWNTTDLWASPLSRAAETARIVSVRDPMIAPELSEMNWGDWEGLRGIDLEATPNSGFRHIEHWGWAYHAPNGESPQDLWDRLTPWLNALTQDAVVVCHIGVMRVLLARAHGWDFDGPAPFRIKRNRLFTLSIDGTRVIADPEPIRLIRLTGAI